MIELQQMLDLRKAQYEFNLLEEQKEAYIQANDFDMAMEIVSKQKGLNIVSTELIDQKINQIQVKKEAYIQLLEANIKEQLKLENYQEVLSTLEELKHINPDGSYDALYVHSKAGLFEFNEAEERIKAVKKVDQQQAEELEQVLVTAKTNVFDTIRNAVRKKDYHFFKKHLELRNVKDSWNMTPLMHFIIHRDIDGIKTLAATFNPNDRNILGHNALHMIQIHDEDEFAGEVLALLDETLINMLKEYKGKRNLNKVTKLALKGVDTINTKALMNVNLAEATSNVEDGMNTALEEYERQMVSYTEGLIIENSKEFIGYMVEPYNFKAEHYNLVAKKKLLINELEEHQEKKSNLELDFEVKVEEAKVNNLDDILFDAARIALGTKDEFETTAAYENRKRDKAKEMKISYQENEYVTGRLKRLEEELKETFYAELDELETAITSTAQKMETLESNAAEIYNLAKAQSNSDLEEVLYYYYHTYHSKLELGSYDADLEVFKINANGEEQEVKVPLTIAKAFKAQFLSLKPTCKIERTLIEDKEKVYHNFVFNFEGEQIIVPFMHSITE